MRLVPLLVMLACASVQQPPPDAAIREAVALGAERIPTARLHLQRAREQRDNFSVAQADADYALALAEEAAVHRELLAVERALGAR